MCCWERKAAWLAHRLFQIALQIVHVLDADAQPHQAVIDAARVRELGGDAGVRHRRRMAHQRFDAAEALGEAEQLRPRHELQRRVFAALQPIEIMPPKSRICCFASRGRGGRQTRIVDALDRRLFRQPLGQSAGVAQWRSMRTASVLMPRRSS